MRSYYAEMFAQKNYTIFRNNTIKFIVPLSKPQLNEKPIIRLRYCQRLFYKYQYANCVKSAQFNNRYRKIATNQIYKFGYRVHNN